MDLKSAQPTELQSLQASSQAVSLSFPCVTDILTINRASHSQAPAHQVPPSSTASSDSSSISSESSALSSAFSSVTSAASSKASAASMTASSASGASSLYLPWSRRFGCSSRRSYRPLCLGLQSLSLYTS